MSAIPQNLTERQAVRLLLLFLAAHCVVWTVFTGLSRHELDGDTLLHFAWSRVWQGSYPLHPPFLPWVVRVWLDIFGTGKWAYVALSQFNMLVMFVSVWFLARQFLSPAASLAAVALLELVPYYSVMSLRFNHSALLISVWALAILAFHFALQHNRLHAWALTGLAAAVTMLTKYYSVTLVAAMGLLMLITPLGRSRWRSPGPWLAMGVFLAIMAWHVNYVLANRVGTIAHIGDYFYFDSWEQRWSAISFFLAQVIYVLPVFLVVFFAVRRTCCGQVWSRLRTLPDPSEPIFTLLFIMLFSIGVTTIPGAILGVHISSRWGSPTVLVFTLLLLVLLRDCLDPAILRRFYRIGLGFVLVVPLLGLALFASGLVENRRYGYPGVEIAAELSRRWQAEFDTLPRYVGGGVEAINSLSFNVEGHPLVYHHLSETWSPWVTQEKIFEHGMIIACESFDATCVDNLDRFYPAGELQEITIAAHSNRFSVVNDATLAYKFVPPGADRSQSGELQQFDAQGNPVGDPVGNPVGDPAGKPESGTAPSGD